MIDIFGLPLASERVTMGELETRCLDTFPQWLRSLGGDATALGELVGDASLSESARRQTCGAVNYLFRSLDLIPDGIEDLGYLDDAFVFRVSARLAAEELGGEPPEVLQRLSVEAGLVQDFLAEDYSRLEAFCRTLTEGAVRGRSVADAVEKESVRAELLSELKGWADGYAPPAFGRDEKNLVKLRSFLAAKLPAA